jgi:hypothetical protein
MVKRLHLGWVGNRRGEIIEAVQRALRIGLQIPEYDRCIRLTEYDDAMITPPHRGPFYLVIDITLFSGRRLRPSAASMRLP